MCWSLEWWVVTVLVEKSGRVEPALCSMLLQGGLSVKQVDPIWWCRHCVCGSCSQFYYPWCVWSHLFVVPC